MVKKNELLLNAVKSVFEIQYKRLYLELCLTLEKIYKTWKYDFNNRAQREFYAELYIFLNYCLCFDTEKNTYSADLKKYLNFFCFFWADEHNYLWYGFSFVEETDNELSILFKTLREINTRALKITAFNLANLKKWLRLYAKYDEIFTLFWGYQINDVGDLYPVYVLDNFMNSNVEFAEYYLAQADNLKERVGTIKRDFFVSLYDAYKKLNENFNENGAMINILRELDAAKAEMVAWFSAEEAKKGVKR